VLAAKGQLSDNVGHMLAWLGLTTLTASKCNKGDELPCYRPGCLCRIFFLS